MEVRLKERLASSDKGLQDLLVPAGELAESNKQLEDESENVSEREGRATYRST